MVRHAGCALVGALCASLLPPAPALDEPSVKTDRGVYEPLPVKLPPAGGTFRDPVFGTEILRVTDGSDGKQNETAYSYWPSFNRDSTKLFICSSGQPVLYEIDPLLLRIKGKRPLFAANAPSGYQPRWESAIWSGDDPDALYCHEGLHLWVYSVRTGEYALVKDFTGDLPPGHLAQMSKSLDDNTFGFSRQDPQWKLTGCLVWRRSDDRIVLREDTTELDEVQVDKSGRYCVIKSDKQGRGVVQVRVADLETGRVEALIDDEPDYAPGHSDNGVGTVVGADNWLNRITFRELATPHDVRAVLELHDDWSQDYHLSMLGDDQSWVLVSFYVGNKLPSSGVFRDEIVLVATDGSQRARRLAHHRSVVAGEYWNSPRANISRDGRLVAFTSNWEGTGQRDVFVLKVPDG